MLARRYDTGEPVRITIRDRRIERIEPAWPVDVKSLPYVAPGLFDLQVNGYGGIWFSSTTLTPEQAAQAVKAFAAHGVTRLCPTLITNSFEGIAAGLKAIRAACEIDEIVRDMVAGIHVEGPYLSAEDGPRGAHPKQHVRAADGNEFERWQEIAGGRICLMTIAPEAENAVPFIRQATAKGVRIAIGHTSATTEQIAAAVDAGAVLSTHLGNGAHAMLKRHPNYIWDQLGEPRLHASLITDGHHLPPSVVRAMIAAKGFRKTIITCDASGWIGLPPGEYSNELGRVKVLPSGRIAVADNEQYLAGSGAGTLECVAKAIEFAGLELREAFDMASSNPSRLLGFEEATLRKGSRADLVVFRDERGAGGGLAVVATIAAGECRFGTGG
jgi:N-acetylglucosamine-6-phosphate deacetylase